MVRNKGLFFFLNAPAPREIYPLPLHAPLPIFRGAGDRRKFLPALSRSRNLTAFVSAVGCVGMFIDGSDRKSTRLNSSHANISYAVFCLKKKIKHMFYTPITLREH